MKFKEFFDEHFGEGFRDCCRYALVKAAIVVAQAMVMLLVVAMGLGAIAIPVISLFLQNALILLWYVPLLALLFVVVFLSVLFE